MDIVIPSQLAFDGNVAVLQVEDIHDLGDCIVPFDNFDLSILPALLECVHDGRGVIAATRRSYGAQCACFVHPSKC